MDLDPEEIDRYAFFFDEQYYDLGLLKDCAELGAGTPPRVRSLLAGHISSALNTICPPTKIDFVSHHEAHCAATFWASGFDEALVFIIDGNGEYASSSLFKASNAGFQKMHSYPVRCSLGHLYRLATQLLGFCIFDEYKVMGLAPYGNAERFGPRLRTIYRRHADGAYDLDIEKLLSIALDLDLNSTAIRGAQPSQDASDFAASIQALLEEIVLDLLTWWQKRLGIQNLCLAGGVAQNCVMNGRLAEAGLFRSIYVHPASHDAGAALGAALVMAPPVTTTGGNSNSGSLFSPFLGPKLQQERTIEEELADWGDLLCVEQRSDILKEAAHRIAAGEIIGWVRGRSEFGPRALGNRSIIADGRPQENWQRINMAIKQREGFRPFAPARP